MEGAGVAQPASVGAQRSDWVALAVIYGLLAAGTIFVAAITPNFLTTSNFEAILRNTAHLPIDVAFRTGAD